MENLHYYKTHIPIFPLLVFLLHFSSLHFLCLESLYYLPDEYFINCGSKATINGTNRSFIRDLNSGSVSFSKESEGITANQLLNASLYQTARVFRQQSHYQFKITAKGTYLVRLHFLAFSSSTSNLSTALFDVSASGFKLLSNFTAKNSSNSPVIKEFFLGINNSSFTICFTPQASTLAFINAIEVFLAPGNFSPENYSSNLPLVLHTIYRVNVGGPPYTPDNDTIWRNWDTDDRFLSSPNSAIPEFKANTLSRDTYVNQYVAPDMVYLTARRSNSSSNTTWSFNVSRKNARHLVRVHLCDIFSATDDLIRFDLFLDGKRFDPPYLYPNTPKFIDFVVDSTKSGLINISIAPRSSTDPDNITAFLNGLEILEVMEESASICSVKESKKIIVALVVGLVVGGVFLICILVIGFLFRLKHRKAKPDEASEWSAMPPNGGGSSQGWVTIHGSPITNLHLGLKIPYAEIQHATKNFDKKFLIGEGGFGDVYRATLSDGTKVAVKRGKRDRQGSDQGRPEFQTEIMVLSKIRHRHLVSLIGYCDERSEMILVYEFMEKGSLKDHLYDSKLLPPLSWKQRLEICIGAARGLHYLHTGAAGGIIHRDVKSTNILLDENHVAKVADFGLSKSGPLDETHVSTAVKGTFGYLDPEYMMSQQLTEKSDVYSFGVVLLEVLCARPAIDPMLPREQMNLVEWCMLCKNKGLLEQVVDSSIKGQIDPSSLRKFSETAEKCLQEDAYDRPTMGDVLWDLEYALQLQQTARHREPHEDSTANASSAFVLPNAEPFASFSSTINRDDDMRNDESGVTENEIFSQLRMGDAR